MTARHPSLTKTDIREILGHLEACTEVLDKHTGDMSAMELSLKSMLGALRRELVETLKARDGPGG